MLSRPELIKQLQESLITLKKALHMNRRPSPLEDGLSRSQVELMFLLTRQDCLAVKAIADRLDMSGSAATQAVDGLVERGLVTRQEDPEDRRQVQVALSEAARQEITDMQERHIARLTEILQNISDEELLTLTTILNKIEHPSN